LSGVLEVVGETPARFSGLTRNSPPNLTWWAPCILLKVAPALRVHAIRIPSGGGQAYRPARSELNGSDASALREQIRRLILEELSQLAGG